MVSKLICLTLTWMALAWVGLKAAWSESAANRCFQLHTWGRALCTRHRVQFLPVCTIYHVSILQHQMIFISIIILQISAKIYMITLKMNQNRSETCAYVTPRALSIELNVLGIRTECLFVQSLFVCLYVCVCLFLISEQNVCLYTDWLQHIPWHRSCAQLWSTLTSCCKACQDGKVSSNPFWST